MSFAGRPLNSGASREPTPLPGALPGEPAKKVDGVQTGLRTLDDEDLNEPSNPSVSSLKSQFEKLARQSSTAPDLKSSEGVGADGGVKHTTRRSFHDVANGSIQEHTLTTSQGAIPGGVQIKQAPVPKIAQLQARAPEHIDSKMTSDAGPASGPLGDETVPPPKPRHTRVGVTQNTLTSKDIATSENRFSSSDFPCETAGNLGPSPESNPFEDSHTANPFADDNDVSHTVYDEPESIAYSRPPDRSDDARLLLQAGPSPLKPPRGTDRLQSPFEDSAKVSGKVDASSRYGGKPVLPAKPPRRHAENSENVKPALPPRRSLAVTTAGEHNVDRPPQPYHRSAQKQLASSDKPPPLPPRVGGNEPNTNKHGSKLTVSSKVDGNSMDDAFAGLKHANRVPPAFSELKAIQPKNSIRTFGLAGDLVVTDFANTRVWSLRSAEMISTIPHESSKVTSLHFRPSRSVDDVGRYVWCGTQEGVLFAVDISTCRTTEMTSKAHNCTVSFILRHEFQLWTIDDNGKMNVWSENDEGELSLMSTPKPLRLASKQTCALVVGHQLWMGAGKAIEVFRFLNSEGRCNLGTRLDTNVDHGNVTCMSQMSDGSIVYVGHDNGTMSLWDVEELTRLRSVSISSYCITTMLGVGVHLWIGFKTGKIHTYNVRDNRDNRDTWIADNEWESHESPVSELRLDEDALWRVGRLQVGSMSDKGYISVWDGLLRRDWLANKMSLRQDEYCSYRDITVLICSWNIDASKPAELEESADDVKFLRLCFTSVDSPDIIVIGFQEIIDLESKKMTAKTMFMQKKATKKADKQLNENVTQRYRLWYDRLVKAVREHAPAKCTYKPLESANLVGLFTCVFVKETEARHVKDVAVSTRKTGLKGYHGNKGAIAMRFIYDDSSVCFVNCHLAAGHDQTRARNTDALKILEETEFISLANDRDKATRNDYGQVFVNGGDGSMILDHEICFFSGDLNYRIDLSRDAVIKKIEDNDISGLLEHDQLVKQRQKNPSFRLRLFNEGRITFAPTYKYNTGEDSYDTSEKRRTPAWCDRILYRGRRIQQLDYRRYECRVSDHRPISGAFRVKVKTIDKDARAQIEDEVQHEWEMLIKNETQRRKVAWLTKCGWDAEAAKRALHEGGGSPRKAAEILKRSVRR